MKKFSKFLSKLACATLAFTVFLGSSVGIFSKSKTVKFATLVINLSEETAAALPYSWWYPDVYASAKAYVVDEVWNRGFWFVDRYLNDVECNYINMYYYQFGSYNFDIYRVFDEIYATKPTMDGYDVYLRGYYYWDVMYAEYNRLYYIIKNSIFFAWMRQFDANHFYDLQNDFLYGYYWY